MVGDNAGISMGIGMANFITLIVIQNTLRTVQIAFAIQLAVFKAEFFHFLKECWHVEYYACNSGWKNTIRSFLWHHKNQVMIFIW